MREVTMLQLEVATTNMIEGLIKLGVPRESLEGKLINRSYFCLCYIKYTHDFSYAKLDNISVSDCNRTITLESNNYGGWRVHTYGPRHFVKRPKTLKKHLDKAVESLSESGLRKTAIEIAHKDSFAVLKLYDKYRSDKRMKEILHPGLGKYRTGTEELKKK